MKNQPFFAARFLAVTIAVAALASCGGGGGGGGGGVVVPPAIALTAANAQNVAGDAAIAAVQAPDRVGGLGLASAALGGNAAPRTHVLSRFLEQQVERAAQVLRPGPAALAAPPPTCMTGDMTVNVIGSGTVVETFNACVLAPGESISGSVAISGITSTPSSFSASISTNLTFSFTGFADQTFTGNFTLSHQGIGSSVETTTISGSQLILHQGTDTQQLANFSLTVTTDISGDSDTVTFTFSSDEIGGSVAVTTLTPFQTTPGRNFPHTGAIRIVGANGSKIVFTVNGDEAFSATKQVKIQLDADGDDVFELTLDKDWADLTV